jgi:hypothetical protein
MPLRGLRFIFRHCDPPQADLIPQDLRALHLVRLRRITVPSVCGLFTRPSIVEWTHDDLRPQESRRGIGILKNLIPSFSSVSSSALELVPLMFRFSETS